ncbi:MAG: apolipoprotein N-acyltransferase [Planctomycetota bacterium]
MPTLLWSLAAAGSYGLAFHPAAQGWLAWGAITPWCILAGRARSWARTFGLGYLLGAAILTVGCFWLRESHPLNLVVMVGAEATFFGLFLVLLHATAPLLPFFVGTPLLFVGIEWVRGCFPLDGFPWLFLGYTQAGWQTLVQVADLTGVYGVSFLLAFSGGLLADSWLAWKKRARSRKVLATGWLTGGLLLAAALLYGGWRRESLDAGILGPPLVAVQGNIPQQLKRSGARPDEIYAIHARLTREGLAATPVVEGWPPLVVWSETMFPFALAANGHAGDVWDEQRRPRRFEEAEEVERVLVVDGLAKGLLEERRACLLLGVPTLAGHTPAERRCYNSAILYRPDGSRAGVYHKVIRVPGGEYLPGIDYLPFSETIRALVESVAGFVPELAAGDLLEPLVLDSAQGPVPLGVSICYENIYASHARCLVRRGARLLVNLSNEAWFRDSAEMDQMHAMSVFRAVETRRSLLRCTNSGITALYDPAGRSQRLVVNGRDREVGGVLRGRPHLCSESSFYVASGDWLAMACAGLTVLLVVIRLFLGWAVTGRLERPL